MRKTTAHLDPAAIVARNAKRLADAQGRPDFPGPQMIWHRKPNEGGGPCDVCGCPGLRLGVDHRSLAFGESVHARYTKRRRDYSGDYAEMALDANGKGV